MTKKCSYCGRRSERVSIGLSCFHCGKMPNEFRASRLLMWISIAVLVVALAFCISTASADYKRQDMTCREANTTNLLDISLSGSEIWFSNPRTGLRWDDKILLTLRGGFYTEFVTKGKRVFLLMDSQNAPDQVSIHWGNSVYECKSDKEFTNYWK